MLWRETECRRKVGVVIKGRMFVVLKVFSILIMVVDTEPTQVIKFYKTHTQTKLGKYE